MEDVTVDDLLRELAGVGAEVDEARADRDIARMTRLRDRQAELRAEIKRMQDEDPELEAAALRHELAGLERLVAQEAPDFGWGRAMTGGGEGFGGGSGTFAWPHSKHQRDAANDASGGYRSRNDALQRIVWIRKRLAELDMQG